MKLADAMNRIEELERKVKELESRPIQHIHYHPMPQPLQIGPNSIPQRPYRHPWEVLCSVNHGAYGAAQTMA